MPALRNNLGRVLQALASGEAALGPDHPDAAIWCGNLGSGLHDLGDLEGARVQYELAVVISEAALDPDHATVATIRRNLDSLLQAL